MNFEGQYILKYLFSGQTEELIVKVELKPVEGMVEPGQNAYEGFAWVNGKKYKDDNLKYCVDAKLYAEKIGFSKKAALRKKHGRKLRVKEEKVI